MRIFDTHICALEVGMARKPNKSRATRKSPTAGTQTRASKRPPNKRPTNLTLDPEAVARGERFGQRHGTSLSQLVTGFLYSLPGDAASMKVSELAPPVRRLYGVATGASGAATDRETYRAHLDKKYGRR
jgi:hypothetical protein